LPDERSTRVGPIRSVSAYLVRAAILDVGFGTEGMARDSGSGTTDERLEQRHADGRGDRDDGSSGLSRRSVMKAAGAAGMASLVPFGSAGTAAATDTSVVDDAFDLSGGLQEALVVFDSAENAERLDTLSLAKGYRVFDHLAIAWTFLDPDQVKTVADWGSVRRVKRSEELEWYNDETSRTSMAIDDVRNGEELGYVGEDAHVVVIDSGIDASHPGLEGRVEANYRFVDEGVGSRDPLWVDAAPGDTDQLGHGTHCAGIVGGDGSGSVEGEYSGMAPAVTLTGYSTTRSVYLPYVVAAWNHMLGRAKADPDFSPDVVSNSYGVARDMPYNPNDPVNVASWRAFEEGILPVFAMGNDGSGTGTSSRFAKAPHVLGAAAAEKSISPRENTENRPIAGFSSRGRELPRDAPEYNRETTLENLRKFWAIQDGTTYAIPANDPRRTGMFGPGVNSSPGIGAIDEEAGAAYEILQTNGNADVVSLTLSITPDGQWVRTTVYDEDGERVAMMGEEPPHQHRTLTFDVDGGEKYYVELEPELSASGEYTITWEQEAKPEGDLASVEPVTLFRPSLSTHGTAVMSTIDKYDALGPLGPAYGGSGTEPFYTRLSGTSMACPGAAGIGALAIEAYRANHPEGDSPDPADVIRVMESTARDFNPNYNAYNTGAGFVDAEAAVDSAEELAAGETTVADLQTGQDALVDPAEKTTITALSASGSRSDDGSAFTGGQTNQVTLTVSDLSHDATEVWGVVPSAWDVRTEYGDVERVEETDGAKRVYFGSVTAPEVTDGDTTFEYFAEAPSGTENTGTYTFGPAHARTDAGVDKPVDEFAGIDTNYVVGEDTNV
jgi:serine protease AprX